jgi:polyhydroxyalkanoate synthesis regulator phasin
MGWGRFLLLGDLGQQLDLADQKEEIENLRNELQRSHASPRGVTGDIERLQAENDEMRLYLATVVRLLVSKGIVSQEEIRRVVDAIDAEDGTRDGRYKGSLQ